ncbi:MAG: hypothetical protein QG657_2066 [Acidobacteriota bacterium]|nr:hypothetical protein [Acidobacteriota bacterium]
MSMKSVIESIFKKKTDPKERTAENIDIKKPVSFNQAFFLYNVYQWMQEKPQAANDKREINSLIAINYFRWKKKLHFPDRSFDDFKDMDGLPMSDYVDDLFEIKKIEGLISELDLSYILTDNGKRVVEIIKRGNYYEYDFFDQSIRLFNQGLIDFIEANIGDLKTYSDNSLISTALQLIHMKSATR